MFWLFEYFEYATSGQTLFIALLVVQPIYQISLNGLIGKVTQSNVYFQHLWWMIQIRYSIGMGQKCWIISCVKYALGERFIANLKCAVCFHCCIQCPLLVGLFFNVFWGYRYICVCHMQDTFFFECQSAKLNLKIALPIKMETRKNHSDFQTVSYMQSNTFSNS